ncbi:C40 family peptidase [Phaeacidiphilus oryzae]|uniref:C40 family peptidase n=1 Tax=Phaeacidiphilus oryzae TaxID=348818 RepID=UPI000569AA5C|nr:C40 family peptidase [Phaeacidiphilus oryzae]
MAAKKQTAQKQPGKHRKPRRLTARTARARTAARSAAGLTAAAAASVGVIADPGSADAAQNRPTTPSQARAEIDRLYQQSERETQDYDQATTRLRALQRRADEDRTRLARGQAALESTRTALGAVAAAQYRTGAFTESFRLAFSGSPDRFLAQAGALNQVTQAEKHVLDQYGRQVRALTADRAAAEAAVARASAEQQRLAQAKDRIRSDLAQAQHLLSSLTAADQVSLEKAGSTTPPASTAPAPDAVAAAVVAFAEAQLGKPYAWGAAGPDAYDCSGLTEKAYAAAGISLPRTTYQQVDVGRRIPVSQLAPGDLVFYYSGRSHVGIYVGGGKIIHAPHPGAPVRYAPLDSMPISAATRPA